MAEGTDGRQTVFIIVLDLTDDRGTGRAGYYYIEDGNGLRALPIFTSGEGVIRYAQTNSAALGDQMDTMEDLPTGHTGKLTDGRFVVLELVYPEELAEVMEEVEPDYLVRNPMPGERQEVMLLSDEAGKLLG